MSQEEHFQRLRKYYTRSRKGFDLLLWGAKHFGFHPKNRKVSEKEAQLLMQDLIGEKLGLSSSMKVLDAGCGQGVVAIYLARKFGCRIEGITVIPFEIEEARMLVARFSVSNLVRFSLMDYSNMQFENNSFDAIYTIESLCHSMDTRRTLSEFYRVLKKGGRIALFEYTLAEDEKFSLHEMSVLNNVIHLTAMDGLKELRHDRFQNIIKEVGFANVKVEDISQNVGPSLLRLRRIALIPYALVRLIGQGQNHPNLTAAVEFYKMGKRGLFRYNIFTAEK